MTMHPRPSYYLTVGTRVVLVHDLDYTWDGHYVAYMPGDPWHWWFKRLWRRLAFWRRWRVKLRRGAIGTVTREMGGHCDPEMGPAQQDVRVQFDDVRRGREIPLSDPKDVRHVSALEEFAWRAS